MYDEDWDGNIEITTEVFEMKYVTGTNVLEILYYPDDIPIYNVYLKFDSAYYEESIYFTPYGIYDFVSEENEMYNYGTTINGNHFGDKLEKTS